MKLLAVCLLLAAAASAAVRQAKRSPLYPYPQVYSLSLPFVQPDVSPYGYWLPPYEPIPPLTAVVDLKNNGEGDVIGRLTLIQPPGGPVFYSGNITGLAEGDHGMTVHEFGDLGKGCESLGDHFNPTHSPHGGPTDPYRHVGDLGNIKVGSDGIAKISDSDPIISLTGPNSIIGRGLVIHDKRDDLGRGGDKESLRTGNSGDRVACGVIAWAQPVLPKHPQGAAQPAQPEGNSDAEVIES